MAACDTCFHKEVCASFALCGCQYYHKNPPQQQWIPVTERLPENTVEVLVFRPKMKIEIGISCRIDDEWLRYGKDLHGNDVITHWMPLPEPPEVE